MSSKQNHELDRVSIKRPGTGELRFTGFKTDKKTYHCMDDIHVNMEISNIRGSVPRYVIGLLVNNDYGLPVLHLDSRLINLEFDCVDTRSLSLTIRKSRLVSGNYRITGVIFTQGGVIDNLEGGAEFTISPDMPYPAQVSVGGQSLYNPVFEIEEQSTDDMVITP